MKLKLVHFTTLFIVCLSLFYTKIHAQTITMGTITGSPFCQGAAFSVPYTTTGTFNASNTFYIEMSDQFGNFPTPFPFVGSINATTSNSVFCTIPASAPASNLYVFRAVSNSPIVTSGNVSNAITVQLPAGNPAGFGTNQWNAYAFSDNNFTTYAGSFVIPTIDFDTQTFYNANASPSSVAGYSGCAVPADNHSVRFKRSGFPCDFYQIDIPAFDDQIEIIVNGTSVYTNNTPSTNISNVARVFLGTNSTVEVRLREFTAGSFAALRFTPVPAILTSPIVYKCSAAAVTLTATSSQAGLAYSWTEAGNPRGSTASISVNPAVNTTYVVTVADPANLSCSKSMSVDVIVTGASVTTVNPNAFSSCGNAVLGFPLTASGAYTYTWSPAAGLSATTGSTVIATPTTSTTYTVIGDNGCGVTSSTTVTFTIGNGGGNPAVFGTNQWNVYAYNGSNFDTYTGYYIEPSFGFDSSPRWAGGNIGSPSSASGYVGCNVGVDNHSVVYKRQGFPCGRYQLDIPNHDDAVTVFVNGTQVFYNGGCCAFRPNIWTGYLDATSTIEYRWQEGGGGSQGSLTFTLLPTTLFNTASVNVCPNINQTVTANLIAGATYVWNNTTPGFVSATANVLTVNQPNGATRTYNVVATLNGCPYPSSIIVNFTATNPVVTITAPVTSICAATPVTLTASGATTYTWSPATGLSATTGAIVTANPSSTTTYTVTGFNDCLFSNTATVTVSVPISPSVFPANVWNAYVYSGTGFGNNPTTSVNPPLSTYQGYYTENTLNFFSANVWVAGQNGTPSSVSNYVGCPVGVDNHSVVYRRQGFPCGYYSLDVVHDDAVVVFVDGVQVFSDPGCCALRPSVWTGFLGASSTVELRWTEGGGGSYGGITFNAANPQIPLFSAIPNSVTMCEGLTPTSSASTLTANTVAGVVYTWAVTTGTLTLSAATGTSIQVYAPPGSTGTGSVTCTATVAGCSFPKVINFTINPNPSTAVTSNRTSICLGETANLTATGANTYTWTLTTGNTATAGLSATTGFSITSTPTATGTYTYSVAGSNNCNTISQTVTITVLGPTLAAGTPGTTATGGWNVFCYAGNADGLVGSIYKGHYTESDISFNSLNRWGTLSSPYPPAGAPIATYVGCEMPVDVHTLRYIRTGFPCGNYKIDVPYHDDTYQLFIDGAQVNTHVGCCDSHANVWNGLLTPTSVVEFRWYEGNGGSSGALNIGFTFTGVTTTTWTGAVNSNWFDPANWCVTVPNSTTNVIIPPNAPNMPIINAAGAQALNIEINSSGALSGSLTILGTNSMNIFGNFTNNGVFVANNSTVNFVGTIATSIGGTTVTNFNNLNLNSTQTVSLANPIQVSGILSLNNTQLSLNNNTLTINNPSLIAITHGASGFIMSETNAGTNGSILCWNAGATVGNFEFPFGTSATSYIPAFFNKKTATNYSICMSTRGTGTNNLPIAAGANLLNIYGFLNGENVVDRWWDINTSLNPLPLADAADITLTYRGLENTTPAANTGILAIQHFDPITGLWEIPYASATIGVTSGTSTITAMNVRKFSPHVIVPIVTPLPIELLYFSARKNNTPTGAVVDINWETITETNNEYFDVERSVDNVRFERIGTVLAKKTTGNKTYNLIDKNPLAGTSYYRLKQVDNNQNGNGKTTYSKSVSVNFGEKNVGTLDIFPNPTTQDNIGLALYGEKEESYQISISNMEGKVIFSQNIKTDVSGKYKATLAMQTTLAQGVYVMKAVSENNVFVKKIIIQ